MDTIECPKCKHEHWTGGQEDSNEMACEECGFRFVVEMEYVPDYETHCVNHSWSTWQVILSSPQYEFRACALCLEYESREWEE